MPMLSIVIPNYNYGRFADRFFSSIAAQSMTLEKVELIFVDDGSSDNSLEQARQWAERISCERFEILTPSRSGKPGLVRNHGLERAKGELLLCIDPDDVLHPDFLSSCVEAFEENGNVDIVYTDYFENSTEGSREIRLPDFNKAHLRTQNALPPAAMYRRTLWDSGTRYRENTEYEDWDYWVQCQMSGAGFLRIPRSLYTYEIHDMNYSHHAVENDGQAKARIVLNNPAFFHPMVLEWAIGHLRNRLHSQAFQRGYIPRPEDIKTLLKCIEQKVIKSTTPS
ncbi:MAG: glycosyltransferase family 2 protein [Pseudodesulfovibrio sp.]|nr:glycosyltransferase family 2 protein [Pseudodesulfovibrio sp.]